MLQVDEKQYETSYDTTWNISEKTDTSITFEYKDEAQLNIQMWDASAKYEYSSIDEIIDDIEYELKQQNKNYNLLSKQEGKYNISDNDCYKLLYENDDKTCMLIVYKDGKYVVSNTYEANSDYFDFLLDSSENIIYNFKIKAEKFDYSANINTNYMEPNYDQDDILDSLLENTTECNIVNDNYKVNFTIPDFFSSNEIDSSSGYYIFSKDINNDYTNRINMQISATVRLQNIYMIVDDFNDEIEKYKNSTTYSDYSGEVASLDRGDVKAFIYKQAYTFASFDSKDYETKIILELDSNHCFQYDIKSSEHPITEKFISLCNITGKENFAAYRTTVIKDEYLQGTLSFYKEKYNSSSQIININLKLPTSYTEFYYDNRNTYVEKEFVSDLNEKLKAYNIDVKYEVTSLKESDIIDNENSYLTKAYGKKVDYSKKSDFTNNGRKFTVYQGGDTQLSGVGYSGNNRYYYFVNKYILLFKIDDNNLLKISIDSIDQDISEDQLKDLTNFDIN